MFTFIVSPQSLKSYDEMGFNCPVILISLVLNHFIGFDAVLRIQCEAHTL